MKKFLFLLGLFSALVTNAQYFQTGQDPANIKWRQINTTNFQLIYPDYFEEQAQNLALKLEKVYDFGSYSMGYKPTKISVILHTQTVQSNGLVAYAPKRSEFYTTPHQAIYPQDWLEQLAIHEFRHVVQIDKVNEELPGIVKLILGEQGTALVFGTYLPWWFIEGDAVVSETALSKYGRGRFPSFLMEHKAQVVEKGKYSYDKAYLGSYKSYVPNHYKLGYYMVAETRKKYGSEIWEKTVSRVGKKPFSLTPFNKALKLETGLGKVKLYSSVFDSLEVEWKEADKQFQAAPFLLVSPPVKTYTEYQYNHWINENEIVSLKTGLNQIPVFVKINSEGKEEKILRPGIIFDESVNYRGDWIVWAEQIPDVRWSHSGSSLIQFFNIKTNKKVELKTEYKAFAPALSPDLNAVVVVESDFSNNHYLSVYQQSTGEIVKRIHTKENYYFFSPMWLNKDEILAVILNENGKRLALFDLKTGDYKVILDKELGELKQLRLNGNEVYFISSYNGKNALYSYNLSSGSVKLIFEPRFGSAYPDIDKNGNIILSDYTADGFQVIQLEKLLSTPITQVKEEDYKLAKEMAQQEPGVINFNEVDTSRFISKPYKKSSNLFHFHSWAPLSVDPYLYEFMPGFSIMSQNKLGTAETILGYKYDLSEETGTVYAKYRYKGWYPVFDFEVNAGKQGFWQQNTDSTFVRISKKMTELSADIYMPLNLTKGGYYRLLQPEVRYIFTSYNNDDTPLERTYHSLLYRLYYHQILRQSAQDVFPNFGLILDYTYRHSPNGIKGMGSISAGQAVLYLPGFMPNHGFQVYSGTQNKDKGEIFSFSNVVSFPRGWMNLSNDNMSSLALDYKLPLINPDFSLTGLMYVKRITADLFADYANLKGTYSDKNGTYPFDYNISSYGLEIMGDVNFLRFYAPAKIGFRTSYLKETDEFVFDFLLSINFNSL